MSTPMISATPPASPPRHDNEEVISLRDRFESALEEDAGAARRRERKRKAGPEDASHAPVIPRTPEPPLVATMRMEAIAPQLPDASSRMPGSLAPMAAPADASAAAVRTPASGTAAALVFDPASARTPSGSSHAVLDMPPIEPLTPMPAPPRPSETSPMPAGPAVEDTNPVPEEQPPLFASSQPPARGHRATVPMDPRPRPAATHAAPEPVTEPAGTRLTYAFRSWAPGHTATAQLFPPTTPGGELRALIEASSTRVAQALASHAVPLQGIGVSLDNHDMPDRGMQERHDGAGQGRDEHDDEDPS